MDFTPGAGSPIIEETDKVVSIGTAHQPFIIIIGALLLITIIEVCTLVYDVVKKTKNEESQVTKKIKNIIILLLIATVLALLPIFGKDNISLYEFTKLFFE